MPVLKNSRHERFAQERASGKSASESFVLAGYSKNDGNASRLNGNEKVKARIAEIFDDHEKVRARAIEIAAEKLSITKERVLAELARIAFSDLRRAVKWRSFPTKKGIVNEVVLLGSDEIDDHTAAAICEISQLSTGGLKVKLYDKQAALLSIGKELGMFVERVEHGEAGEFERMSDEDLRREIAKAAGLGGAETKLLQ